MDNAHDFMLEEYKQIVKAYADLHTQKSDLLKLYFTIIGIGASAVTLIGKITGDELETLRVDTSTAIGALVLLLFLLGLAILFSLVGIRMEMILYVRTINALRGFFVETTEKCLNEDQESEKNKRIKDFLCLNEDQESEKNKRIKDFLVLPDHDGIPPFFGFYSTSFFWIASLIALINSALLGFGLYTLAMEMMPPFFVSSSALVLQLLYYYLMARYKEKGYKQKRRVGGKFRINASWNKPLYVCLNKPISFLRNENSVANDGEDWTELSLIIHNTTGTVQKLDSVDVGSGDKVEDAKKDSTEGVNLKKELIQGGNLNLGPGETGEQTWRFKIHSEAEFPGDYEIFVYINGERSGDPLVLKVYDREGRKKRNRNN